MSLKSRKSIDTVGPDNHEEQIVSFRKEKDGSYTRVVKFVIRDWKTGTAKHQKKRDYEDGPFSLCSPEDEPDASFSIVGPDEALMTLYFKRE